MELIHHRDKFIHPLRTYRRQHDISLHNLSCKACVHFMSLYNIEQGRTKKPHMSTVKRLFMALNLELTTENIRMLFPDYYAKGG